MKEAATILTRAGHLSMLIYDTYKALGMDCELPN